MPEPSDLDRRLRAVERTLTDGDHDVAALEEAAELVERLDDLEARIATLEERIAELDAATQAVRGYVGNVRAVNEDVEDRADAALAAVDRIEARLDDGQGGPAGRNERSAPRDAADSSVLDAGTTGRATEASREGPHDIEMRAPGARSTGGEAGGDDADDGSVIDRVREAL